MKNQAGSRIDSGPGVSGSIQKGQEASPFLPSAARKHIFSSRLAVIFFLAVAFPFFAPAHAQQSAKRNGQPAGKVTVDKDGTVHVPAFDVPLSSYMSEEAKRAYIEQRLNPLTLDPKASISQRRAAVDGYYRPLVERGKALYPVHIEEQTIAGVRVDVVTPKEGISERNRNRVLINLHGGGFVVGGGLGGLAESIPIASLGEFRVISVDYRMAPEYKSPAASEDVAAVYRELLKQYEPAAIGIYGCSAGGMLTAMAVAWFQKERLPAPGAIGLFCTPDGRNYMGGDSGHLALPLGLPPGSTGTLPTTPSPPPMKNPYFGNADSNDPLFSPFVSSEVLSKFPPALLISGTRDPFLSNVLYIHRALAKAGVEADLNVWDGMWHNFLFEMNLPESKDAYGVIVKFFDKHLASTSH